MAELFPIEDESHDVMEKVVKDAIFERRRKLEQLQRTSAQLTTELDEANTKIAAILNEIAELEKFGKPSC